MYMVYGFYPIIFWCGELRKIKIFEWLLKPNHIMDRAEIQESRRFLSSDKLAIYTFLSKKIHKFE